MMCTYGLNYQSTVYLCYQTAGPTESESPEKVRGRKKKRKKRSSPDGSAEVQIRANDLIVRRSAEGR